MTVPTLTSVRCVASVFACRLRVTQLHADGSLDPGTAGQAVTDSLISIGSTPQVEAGIEITQRNGCGDICVEAVGDDEIKRWDLALSLCQLDYDLIALIVGGTALTKGGVTVGYADRKIGDPHQHVCVEAWSKAYNRSAQAVIATGSGLLYERHVWPRVTFIPGVQTVDANAMIIPFTGKAIENPNMGTGPAADWPATITQAHAMFHDDNIPAAVCGTQNFAVAGSAS